MDLSEIAYTAGFFDGEGCISIAKSGNGTPTNLRIAIAQRDRASLDYIQKTWGVGKVRKSNQKYDLYSLRIQNPIEVLFFLRGILPYLRVKYSQAKLGIAYLEYYSTTKHSGGNGYPLTYKDKELRLRAYWVMRKLKKKIVKG